MDLRDLTIFVSWTEQWDLDTYAAHYLKARRLAPSAEMKARVADCIALCPRRPPYTKSDLDFYLDANFRRTARVA
jgi:hypothetical protein